MPTIVDELTVKLGLDASGFKKGRVETSAELKKVRDEANTTAKDMQASGKQAADFFSGIKTEVLSLLGVFLGGRGIESFIRETARSLGDLGRVAGSIGENAQDIQAFNNAIARMGGSASAAQASLLGLAKARQDWLTFGTGSQQAAFMSAIGASITMSPLQIMEKFSEYAKAQIALPGGEARIRQSGEGAGIDQSTLLAIIQIAKTSDLGTEMRRSVELGDVASKRQIEAATKFQTSVASFEQAIEGLARALVPFEHMSRGLDQIVDNIIHPGSITKREGDWTGTPTDLSDPKNVHINLSAPINWLRHFLPSWMGGTTEPDTSQDGPSTGPRAGAYPSTSPERQRAEAASLSFWKSKGLSPAQAAGMAAQEMAESGGNPGARGDYINGKPTAIGAYQWHADRRARILAATGIDITTATIDQQREAAYWELMNVEHEARRRLMNAQTPEEAGRAATEFERPDPNRRSIIDAERGRDAANILNRPRPTLSGFAKTHPPGGAGIAPGENYRVLTKTELDPSLAPSRLIGPRIPPAANNDNSNTINTGPVIINSPAGDPTTHANEFNRAMQDIAAQAESGAH